MAIDIMSKKPGFSVKAPGIIAEPLFERLTESIQEFYDSLGCAVPDQEFREGEKITLPVYHWDMVEDKHKGRIEGDLFPIARINLVGLRGGVRYLRDTRGDGFINIGERHSARCQVYFDYNSLARKFNMRPRIDAEDFIQRYNHRFS